MKEDILEKDHPAMKFWNDWYNEDELDRRTRIEKFVGEFRILESAQKVPEAFHVLLNSYFEDLSLYMEHKLGIQKKKRNIKMLLQQIMLVVLAMGLGYMLCMATIGFW